MKREDEKGPETHTASPIVAGARMKALGVGKFDIGKERKKEGRRGEAKSGKIASTTQNFDDAVEKTLRNTEKDGEFFGAGVKVEHK